MVIQFVLLLRVQGPTAAGVCVDVCVPCFHKKLYGYPWSVLQPEAMLKCAVRAASMYLVRVHGPTAAGGHVHGL